MNHCMSCWVVPTPNWVFPKIVGFPPQIIHFNRVFHYFHHPFWGIPIFGNTQIFFVFIPKMGEDFRPIWRAHIFQMGWWKTSTYDIFFQKGTHGFYGIFSLICVVCVFFSSLGAAFFSLIFVFSPGEFQAQEKFWGGLGGKWMHPRHIWRILIVDLYPGPWNPKMEHQQ